MMPFTPGPWMVASDKDLGLDLIWTRDQNSPGILIARTCFAPASLANARLIAAAPDLFEALTETAQMLFDDGRMMRNPVGDKIRKALAKARGES